MKQLLTLLIVSLLPALMHAQDNRQSPPNVLVILVDDLGYGDLSCYGAKDLKSPNVDALVKAGMRFDRAYANCPVCSPTRASLLSGKYPELVGVPGVIRTHAHNNWGYLSQDAVLLPKVLKISKYHSAIVGKWHLGLESPNVPTERGFDHFHGYLGDMMDDYYNHRRHNINYMRLENKEIDPKGHATDLFTKWASDYLRERAKAKSPFFLYLAYNAPHTPIQPPKEWVTKVKEREPGITDRRAKLVALIEHLDEGIGKVIQVLKDTKLDENTLVIFTSDNGGQSNVGANNGNLRGGKQEMYEGGIRVPFCAVWPGKIKAGSKSDRIVMSMDIYPTVCEAAGVKITHDIDGRSILPTLLSKEQSDKPRDLFWTRREGGNRYQGKTIWAFRRGDWKLLQNLPTGPFELYNLEDDPLEKNDLSQKNRQKFNEMSTALRAHIQRGGAIPWQKKAKTEKQSSREKKGGFLDPFVILLVGMVTVIGSILALRLPAFLALILGAFLVAVLTSSNSVQQYEFDKRQQSREQAFLKKRKNLRKQEGTALSAQDHEDAKKELQAHSEADDKAAKKVADQTLGERLASGFATTAGKIGILIAMASIIGMCLLESGSADRIVRSMIQWLGESKAAVAFLLSGFLLGIPVFFDTVFYLMIPLGKAMSLRTGKNYVLYILAITAGGSMAHSLVPPTPGPLFVAEQLDINLGLMIMAGLAVGIFPAAAGFLFAKWTNNRLVIPIREVPDSLMETGAEDNRKLPPTWLALLPILLPVIFISGFTIVKALKDAGQITLVTPFEQQLYYVVQTLGNKNIALMIATVIAVGTLVWIKKTSRDELQDSLQKALSSAGMIILITAAGGAFGMVLQQTNVSQRIMDLNLTSSELMNIPLAFLITTLVRTAQGSATVAMMVSVGIMAGQASTITEFHPVYIALAIGCGSKPIAWMNDSGFWVICKMSGMTEKETLKTVTPMSIIMGLTGLAVVMIGASLFPLI